MERVEIGSLLAIVSLGLGITGFFYLAIFMGLPAIVCGAIALYIGLTEKGMESTYIVVAVIGLLLGLAEVVFATLGLLGQIPYH